jgi:hypothetical protein
VSVALRLIWEKTVLMDYCTALMAGRLGGSRELAHAPGVTLDTVEQVARSLMRVQPLLTRLKTVQTVSFIALTEELLEAQLTIVCVPCVMQGILVIIVRLSTCALRLLTQQKTALMEHFTV